MRLLNELFCQLLSALFPSRLLRSVDESPQFYAELEYEWAHYDIAFHAPYIDLTDKLVLDAGCGLGGGTAFYAEQGCHRLIGLDNDANHVRYARAFIQQKRIQNAAVVLGD